MKFVEDRLQVVYFIFLRYFFTVGYLLDAVEYLFL